MNLAKTLLKILFFTAIVAAVVGAVVVLRRPDGTVDVATDEWPDVPEKSAA